MVRLIIAGVLCLALAVPASADRRYVDWTGGGDFENIADAVDWAAASGDTILVRPGTYLGPANRNVSFGGKSFRLESTDGPDVTIIDCEQGSEAFWICNGETADAVVSGFTITNGVASYGGGICMANSAPRIEHCRITNCEATQFTYGGGGIACIGNATPVITDVEISGCHGCYGGGVMCVTGASPTFIDVRFLNNTADARGGGAYIENPSAGPVVFTDCVFYNNITTDYDGTGGGLALFAADPTITGTTFAWNSSSGGAGCITCMMNSSPTLENCILAFSQDGDALHPHGGTNIPSTTHCCVFGNADGDSLIGTHSVCSFDDPRFCDVYAGDLSICGNSPCAPGVNPWGIVVGAYDVGCADCTAPAEERSWGAIKAMFR
jgi:hypothetical protein